MTDDGISEGEYQSWCDPDEGEVPVWTTRDKRKIPIDEMTDAHLDSAITMLE